MLCRVLQVSESGYHAWLKRQPSERAGQDAVLTERIVAIHARSKGTYGVPRIHAQLAAEGLDVSRKRVGDAYDNAMCESFFATLEGELLSRTSFRSHAEAHLSLFEFIEGWYNPHRLHSALDYQSPVDYEKKLLAAA
jgi:putative transposase